MVGPNIEESGHGLVARLKTPGATGFEGAGTRFRYAHRIAFDLAQIGDPHASRIGDRNRAQQGRRVRVSRFATHHVSRSNLDIPTPTACCLPPTGRSMRCRRPPRSSTSGILRAIPNTFGSPRTIC
jgi:hypothetical protein